MPKPIALPDPSVHPSCIAGTPCLHNPLGQALPVYMAANACLACSAVKWLPLHLELTVFTVFGQVKG